MRGGLHSLLRSDSSSRRLQKIHGSRKRRLIVESLEDRRLLAAIGHSSDMSLDGTDRRAGGCRHRRR